MAASPRCGLGLLYLLNVLLLTCNALNLSSSIRPPGAADKAQDFLSHFLATMNLTEPQKHKRPQYRVLSGAGDTQSLDYMLRLYRQHAGNSGATASVIRSFQNEGMLLTLYKIPGIVLMKM